MVLELREKNICTDIVKDMLNHNGYINRDWWKTNKDHSSQENAWAFFWTFEDECVEWWRVDSKDIFSSESRHGALSNGSHVYCHKIIFYLHLLLWSITCQQLQKKLINYNIYFVIFWHWSLEERTNVQSSSQICSILMALIC